MDGWMPVRRFQISFRVLSFLLLAFSVLPLCCLLLLPLFSLLALGA